MTQFQIGSNPIEASTAENVKNLLLLIVETVDVCESCDIDWPFLISQAVCQLSISESSKVSTILDVVLQEIEDCGVVDNKN